LCQPTTSHHTGPRASGTTEAPSSLQPSIREPVNGRRAVQRTGNTSNTSASSVGGQSDACVFSIHSATSHAPAKSLSPLQKNEIAFAALSQRPNLASIPFPQRQPLVQITSNRRRPEIFEKGGKSLFQRVMVVRKPSSLFSQSTSSSKDSTNYPSSAFSSNAGSDTDEDDVLSMSTDEIPPARPLSAAIPKSAHGPYCPRRPNLREILANTAEPPWTLAAFMAYLSNNHCLETLEFTMDAGRYRKHYAKMLSKAGSSGSPAAKDREYVQALWVRLVDAYIRPNGQREVNLHADVRDPILSLSSSELPPAPEKLDLAVSKIYELMEESVLVPFLNSAYPQTAHPTVSSCPTRSDEHISQSAITYEDRSSVVRKNRHARNSPPPQTAVEPHPHSYSAPSMRRGAPSPISTTSKSRFSAKLTQSTSSPSNAISTTTSMDAVASGSEPNLSGTGSGPGMTDDSGSTDSPAAESPTTPPPSSPAAGDSQRPKRDSGMWKKLGRLSMKTTKQRSHGGLREEQ